MNDLLREERDRIEVFSQNLANFVSFQKKVKADNEYSLPNWSGYFEQDYQEISRDVRILFTKIRKYLKQLDLIEAKKNINLETFTFLLPKMCEARIEMNDLMQMIKEKFINLLADLLEAHITNKGENKWE